MIRLFADGIIFEKDPMGGIARLYREIWPRMCDIDAEMNITVFLDGPVQWDENAHPQIKVKRAPAVKRSIRVNGKLSPLLLPVRRSASRLWKLTRSLWIGEGSGMIWHSTYYTRPEVWRGFQVITVYDMIHELFPDLYNSPLDGIARQEKKRCIEQADAIICISDVTRMDVEKFYEVTSTPIYVIPVALSDVFQRSGDSNSLFEGFPREPFLLYVGKRSHHKNFHGFVNAFRDWKNHDEICLVAVGNPWNRHERVYLEELGLSERVKLYSGVDDEGLRQLYNHALAFIFPTLYEGFGLPVLEAMACGCPVVASRIPAIEMTGGDVPFYFDPEQPQSIGQALDAAIAFGRMPHRIQQGIERAKRYSWDHTAKGYLDVYRNLLEE